MIVNDHYTAFRPVLSNSYKGITIDRNVNIAQLQFKGLEGDALAVRTFASMTRFR